MDSRDRQKLTAQSQNLFRTITSEAARNWMMVNHSKTKVLVVSDAISYRPQAFFHDNNGNELSNTSGPGSIKVLGFHISEKPGVICQVKAIRRSLRGRIWVLWHLRVFGLSERELVEVYKTVIQTVADYCCVAYHSQLTDEQDEVIERLQSHAVETLHGINY